MPKGTEQFPGNFSGRLVSARPCPDQARSRYAQAMRVAVVIPAAGYSKRYAEADPLGGTRSKLDEDLGGRPVLQRTVELFAYYNSPDVTIAGIVVAGPHEEAAYAEFRLRYGDKMGLLGVTLCRGGRTHRYETVKAALEHVPEDATHIAVHDAARPCASQALLDRVFDAASRHPAVVPAIEVSDTLKRLSTEQVDDPGADPLAAILGAGTRHPLRAVEATVERDRLVAVQTPQVFEAGLLKEAYAQPDIDSTDDASLVERLGRGVVVVEGDPLNVKITRPADLRIARAVLGVGGPSERPVHKRF